MPKHKTRKKLWSPPYLLALGGIIFFTVVLVYKENVKNIVPSNTVQAVVKPRWFTTPTPNPNSSDTIPPTVAIINPLNGTTLPKGSSYQATVQATDDVGVSEVDLYQSPYLNLQTSLVCSMRTGLTTQSCTLKVPTKPGSFQITAYAYDYAGNVSTPSTITLYSQ